MNNIKYLALIVLLAGCTQQSTVTVFEELMDSEWSKIVADNPVYASSMGDLRFNTEWSDNSIGKINEDHQHDQSVLNLLNKMDTNDLDELNTINYKLFKKQYENSVESFDYQTYLMPFSHRGGIQLEHETVNILPLRNAEHYHDWIERLSKLEVLVDAEIQKAKIGIETGIVPPRFLMQKVFEQIKLQAFVSPETSPFFRAFESMDRSISQDDVAAIQAKAKETIRTQVIPAYLKLHQFFKEDYLPACRTSIGIKDINNGKQYYEYLARKFTTTSLTPQEIHNIGLGEVARIKSEMEAIIKEVKWQGTFKGFLDDLRSNPKFYYETSEELFEAYLATSKRIDPELVNIFKVLPSMPYGLKPIPIESAPDTTTAYYQRPAADGSRAGYYYVNLYRPEVRPKYEIEVLSVHEAVPGHHLQIALAMELDLPNFRKYGGVTAFVEGWGLYSESLGYDLGLYKDPYSQFGQLTYDMWRAIRLVVDTGMHYFDWSRQDAINYFLDNSAKTKQDVMNEVDRYINWPGQALAYKIGQLKIQELKDRAKDQLGDNFNIKYFHHEEIKRGALPLDILEQYIDQWILEVKNSA
jgi:prolyl oligopeptidase